MTGKKAPFTTYYTRDAQGNTMAVYDNSSYKSDWVACELDRTFFDRMIDRIAFHQNRSIMSEDPDYMPRQIDDMIQENGQNDSCRIKYIQQLSRQPLPCRLSEETLNMLQQLYHQDHVAYSSMDENQQKAYLIEKYNENHETMTDEVLCLIGGLKNILVKEEAMFQEWLQAHQNEGFEEKVEQFFAEFQQIPINYGTITDTAYQDSLYWKEQHLYGSSRLGIAKPELEVTNYMPSNASTLTTNFRNYELTNHLGNVLATIKDEKQQIDANKDGIVDYYEPIVITLNDYYPFGLEMSGRNYSLSSKKYPISFNGKPDDEETGWQDYGMRMYLKKIGRFPTVDPLTQKFPMLTPYQFASNTPIQAIDLDGLEAFVVHGTQQREKGINLTDGVMKELKRIGGNTISKKDFDWNSPIYNNTSIRNTSAHKLVNHIKEQRSILLNKGVITENEPITIIGYSHGGNVGVQATEILGSQGIHTNLITISTPAQNDPDKNTWYGPTINHENPENKKGIDNHVHIYHEKDLVQPLVGDREYKNAKTSNYKITDKEMPMKNGIEAHTEIYKNKAFEKKLKEIPNMKKGK